MAVPSRPAATAGPPTTPAPVAAVPAPRLAPASGTSTALVDAPGTGVAGLAWIVREVTHVPGVLRLRDGRLSFESTRGVLFEGTPGDLDLEVPRSSRSGLRVSAGGERLRICVVRPAGGVAPCGDLVERAADDRPVTSGEMDSWSVWRPLLAPEQVAGTRPGARVRRALAFTRQA
ncbi:hypothetical protein [Actinomycetospora flava]|uniref:Htaa protein n=1 Tax=Actinomycetospora flava TaxID=3129232 RepID=A0ABU8MEZ9_9PSEU